MITTTNFKEHAIVMSNSVQWNFDVMKGQGTGKVHVCLL